LKVSLLAPPRVSERWMPLSYAQLRANLGSSALVAASHVLAAWLRGADGFGVGPKTQTSLLEKLSYPQEAARAGTA
jgi:hypothetical protein